MRVAEMLKEVEDWERAVELRGEARVVLKLLRLKFGELPEAAVARIEAAGMKDLETWTERVLTATSLDEVLTET